MSSLLDYLDWRGDLKVDFSHPFNTVDAMILARISYFPLNHIRFTEKETIAELMGHAASLSKDLFNWPDDHVLARKLALSKRFRDMKIENFRLENDDAIEKQFGAVTIWLRPGVAYISFLGTDSSLSGWKEDFNMTFMDEVPAQAAAAEYFKRFVFKHPLSKVYLGGHSKGGNLAIYTAVTASDLGQRRIKKVYNFDGPGLNKHLLEKDKGRPVSSKIESFIPQDSLIGRLLEHREKVTVVESSAAPLYQHDIYTWNIEGNDLVRSASTHQSDFNDRVLKKWLEHASLEERKAFIDSCYQVLKKSHIGTPIDVALGGVKNVPAILKAYRQIDKPSRKVIVETFKKLAGVYFAERKTEKGTKKK